MKKNKRKYIFAIMIVIVLFIIFLNKEKIGYNIIQDNDTFRFISLSDTQSQPIILSKISDQIISQNINPDFIIYPGDLEQNGFTLPGIEQWKLAMNGQLTGDTSSNQLYEKTFMIRGNHDEQYRTDWQNYFNMSIPANYVRTTYFYNYPTLQDLAYSFDYKNSHFIGVEYRESLNTQVKWIEKDIQLAELRGLKNVFIYYHVSLYCGGNNHCGSCYNRTCDNRNTFLKNLTKIINNHPIVTAVISGHEHIGTFTCLDNTRILDLNRSIIQIVNSPAGAGNPDKCNRLNRWDNCTTGHGFNVIEVNDEQVTLKSYSIDNNNIIFQTTFNKNTECILPNSTTTSTTNFVTTSTTTSVLITTTIPTTTSTMYVTTSTTNPTTTLAAVTTTSNPTTTTLIIYVPQKSIFQKIVLYISNVVEDTKSFFRRIFFK